jgi:hypothetical protein
MDILDQAAAIIADKLPKGREAITHPEPLPTDDTRLFVAYNFERTGEPLCAIYIKPAGMKCGNPDCSSATHDEDMAFGMTPDGPPFPVPLPIAKARSIRRMLALMPGVVSEEVTGRDH